MQAAVEENVTEEESTLARKLKALCTSYGEERKETLSESAQIFLDFGKIYIKKALGSEGMLRKLCFIKSAALLHGAKVRSIIQESTLKREEVLMQLAHLSACILARINTGSQEKLKNLTEISDRVSTKLKKLRQNAENLINTLPKVNTYHGSGLAAQKKVAAVQLYSWEITVTYKYLMQEIADECIALLGKSPCQFAMVGLGSLARDEITLYSDFEHVIVLDDEAQRSEDFESTREYFRWFAVVFQVILIGLGETFIRSVGVKSFNDLYGEDKANNWYYDVITPCGIAFDGMVPHSCNNPLGRQEATKTRTHVVELIQPAFQMAKYLTHDEHVKNGYYLKDLLMRTCHVYGSYDVYKLFLQHSERIMKSESMIPILNDHMGKIRNNVNKYVRAIGDHTLDGEDVKQSMYRPITAYLAYMARMYQISETSSFAIVTKLHEIGALGSEDTGNIKYAVAVASEVRLKVYVLSGNQRNLIDKEWMIRLIGLESLVVCRETIRYLGQIALTKAESETGEPSDSSLFLHQYKTFLCRVEALASLCQFDKAAELAEEAINVPGNMCAAEILGLQARCFHALGVKSSTEFERRKFFSKAAASHERALSLAVMKDTSKTLSFTELAMEYACLCDDVMFTQTMERWRLWNGGEKFTCASRDHVDYILKTFDPRKAYTVLSDALSRETNLRNIYEMTIGCVRAKIRMGEKAVAKVQFLSLVDDVLGHCRQLARTEISLLLMDIAAHQEKNEWLEDALQTYDLLHYHSQGNIAEPSTYFHFDRNLRDMSGEYFRFSCYLEYFEHRKASVLLNLGRYDACIKYIVSTVHYKKVWPHFRALAICHIEKVEFVLTTKERIELLEKGIKCCRKFQFAADFVPIYNEALDKITWVGRTEVVIRYFTEAPVEVKKSEAFQRSLLNFIYFSPPRHALVKARRGGAFADWKPVLEVFPEYVLQPLSYETVTTSIIEQFKTSADEFERDFLEIELEKLREKFLMRHFIQRKGGMIKEYNAALCDFSHLQIESAARLLWPLVCCASVPAFVKQRAIELFLSSLVLTTLCYDKSIPFWPNGKKCIQVFKCTLGGMAQQMTQMRNKVSSMKKKY